MLYLLGILDIISGIWIIVLNYGLGLSAIGGLLAGYLILKGVFFRENFMSYVDLFCGAFMLFILFGMQTKFLYLIPAVYLMQKGIISFL